MMKKTTVVVLDDINGAEGAETVSFSFNGVAYEIDLAAENLARFNEVMSEWIKAGRRVGGRAVRGTRRAARGAESGRSQAIREWARAKGIELADRGRIPGEIVAKYEAENA